MGVGSRRDGGKPAESDRKGDTISLTEKVSPKTSEGKEGVTIWDKSCCRVEEGEDGPWVRILEASGNLDSKVRGEERSTFVCVCACRHTLKLTTRNGHRKGRWAQRRVTVTCKVFLIHHEKHKTWFICRWAQSSREGKIDSTGIEFLCEIGTQGPEEGLASQDSWLC